MSGRINGVQQRIKSADGVHGAHYVHCFCHRLNLIVQDIVKLIDFIELFFLVVQDIFALVSGSVKRWTEYTTRVKDKLKQLIESGAVETGRGLNQATTMDSLAY